MKNYEKDSPSIPQRVLVEQESGSEVLVSTPAWLALAKKAGKNDVPLSVLEQVYARGIVTSEPHPKNTPEQQAFHRVESFIHEGKAYELDNDLTEACAVPDGSKHMDVIKNAIKNHKERIKSQQQVNEAGNLGLLGLLNIAHRARSRSKPGGLKRFLWNPTRRGDKERRQASDDYESQKERVASRTQAGIEGKALGKYRAEKAASAQPGSELAKAHKTATAPKPYKPKAKPPPYVPGEWAKKHPPTGPQEPEGVHRDKKAEFMRDVMKGYKQGHQYSIPRETSAQTKARQKSMRSRGYKDV